MSRRSRLRLRVRAKPIENTRCSRKDHGCCMRAPLVLVSVYEPARGTRQETGQPRGCRLMPAAAAPCSLARHLRGGSSAWRLISSRNLLEQIDQPVDALGAGGHLAQPVAQAFDILLIQWDALHD